MAIWGPEDLLGPRAPGLEGVIRILGRPFPKYELLLIALGPLVLGLLWLLFNRTRWGTLVRAATQDREMTAALGINQTWLFTSVLFLGSLLAGLGGALQIPREAVNLHMDINIVVEAFVVVVVGGMGSVGGAFLAAVLIGQLQAFGILIFPQITLVIVFLFMAVVLVVRPHGLLGRPQALARVAGTRAGAAAAAGHPSGTAGGDGLAGGPGAASGVGRRLRADGADRNPDPDAVRRQPAFHHGAGRHDLVRPCRVFRAGSLWRRSAGEALRGRHAAGAGGGAAAGRCGGRCCSAGSACGCRASTLPC